MAVSSWSDLPGDILQIICQKLTDINDYAAFGAVCSYWRFILWLCHKHIPSQLPVLMIPNDACTLRKRSRHRLLSMNTFKASVLHSTAHMFSSYFGLNHGWILTRNDLGFLYLVNPFLSANNYIKLPLLNGSVKLMSAVLSDNPTLTSNYVVMVTYTTDSQWGRSSNGMSFFRSGEKSWRNQKFLSKIIYYRDQFYGIDFSLEAVVSCDTSSDQPKVTKVAKLPPCTSSMCYLVESFGELLFLNREVDFSSSYLSSWPWSTSSFQIFKLRQTETSSEWDEVNNLRGHALFVANTRSTSFSLLASDFRNCRANSIYFIETDGSMLKLFNLDDASVVNLFSPKDLCSLDHNLVGSVWIQPTLNVIKGIHACDRDKLVTEINEKSAFPKGVKRRRHRMYKSVLRRGCFSLICR